MSFKVLAVFLGTAVCLAAAGPSRYIRGNDDICAAQCSPSSKLNFIPGKTYVYKYETKTVTALEQSSDKQSNVHLSADAHLHVLDSCRFALKVENVDLREEIDGQRKSMDGVENLKAKIMEESLVFNYEDGRVVKLCPAQQETAAALNIKRGILSMLQNTMQKLEKDEVTTETDVSGQCQTKYTASNGWSSLVIKKEKQLSQCDKHAMQQISMLALPKDIARSSSIINGTQSCEQSMKDKVINNVECIERHVVRPLSENNMPEGKAAATTVYQKLNLKTVEEIRNLKIDYKPVSDKDMLYDAEEEIEKMNERYSEIVRESMKNYVRSMKEENAAGSTMYFSQMVHGLRRMDERALAEVYTFAKNQGKQYEKVTRDAIRDAATDPAIKLMVKLVKSGDVQGLELHAWLIKSAFVANLQLDTLRDVSSVLSEGNMESYLAISTMTKRYCEQHKHCENRIEIRNMIARFYAEAEREAQQQNGTGALAALKAIGNIGYATEKEMRILLNIAEKRELTTEVRIAAIEAFRRMSCDVKRDGLMQILSTTHDLPEVRVAAYLNAIRCPTNEMIVKVKQIIENERETEVAAFMYTHVMNLVKRPSFGVKVDSITEDKALENKYKLQGEKYSRNVYFNMFFDPFNAGFELDGNVLFSENSMTPRWATFNTSVDIFGKNVNVFDMGVTTKNLEQIINWISSERSMTTLPEIAAYIRLFGDEIFYSKLSEHTNNPSTLWRMMQQINSAQGLQISRSMVILDTEIMVPTSSGLPIALSVNGTSSISMELKAHHQRNQDDIKTLDISAAPKTEVSFGVSMATMVAGQKRAGLAMTASASSGWTVKSQLKYNGTTLVKINFEVPKQDTELLSAKTKVVLFNSERQIEIKSGRQQEMKMCTGELTHKMIGHKICLDASYPKDKPFSLLRGPTHFNIRAVRTDMTLENYEGELAFYHRKQVSDRAVLRFATPGAQVDREFKFEIHNDMEHNKFHLHILSPIKKVTLDGYMEKTQQNLMKLNMDFGIDGKLHYKALMDYKISKDSVTSYEPTFKLFNASGKQIVSVESIARLAGKHNMSGKIVIKGLTEKPIEMGAETRIAAPGIRRGQVTIASHFITTAFDVVLTRRQDQEMSLFTKGRFNLMQSEEHQFEYRMGLKKDQERSTFDLGFRNSMEPKLNLDLALTNKIVLVRESDATFEHNLQLTLAADTDYSTAISAGHSVEYVNYGLTKLVYKSRIQIPQYADYGFEHEHEITRSTIKVSTEFVKDQETAFALYGSTSRILPINAKFGVAFLGKKILMKINHSMQPGDHTILGSLKIDNDLYSFQAKLQQLPKKMIYVRFTLPNGEYKEARAAISAEFTHNTKKVNLMVTSNLLGAEYRLDSNIKSDHGMNDYLFEIDTHIQSRTEKFNTVLIYRRDLSGYVARIDHYHGADKTVYGSARFVAAKSIPTFKMVLHHKKNTLIDASAQMTRGVRDNDVIISIRHPRKVQLKGRLTHNIGEENNQKRWVVSPSMEVSYEDKQLKYQGSFVASKQDAWILKLNSEINGTYGVYKIDLNNQINKDSWVVNWLLHTPKGKHMVQSAGTYDVQLRKDNKKVILDGSIEAEVMNFVLNKSVLKINSAMTNDRFTLESEMRHNNEPLYLINGMVQTLKNDYGLKFDVQALEKRFGLEGSLVGKSISKEGLRGMIKTRWAQNQEAVMITELKFNEMESKTLLKIETPFNSLKMLTIDQGHKKIQEKYIIHSELQYNTRFAKANVETTPRTLEAKMQTTKKNWEDMTLTGRWNMEPRFEATFEADMPLYKNNKAMITVDYNNRFSMEGTLQVPSLYKGDLCTVRSAYEGSFRNGLNMNTFLTVAHKGQERFNVEMKMLRSGEQIAMFNGKLTHNLFGRKEFLELAMDIKEVGKYSYDTKFWISKNASRVIDVHHEVAIMWVDAYNFDIQHNMDVTTTLLENSRIWNSIWMKQMLSLKKNKDARIIFQVGPSVNNIRVDIDGKIKMTSNERGLKRFDLDSVARMNTKGVKMVGVLEMPAPSELKMAIQIDNTMGQKIMSAELTSGLNLNRRILKEAAVQFSIDMPRWNKKFDMKTQLMNIESHFGFEGRFERQGNLQYSTIAEIRIPKTKANNHGHLRITLPKNFSNMNLNLEFNYNQDQVISNIQLVTSKGNNITGRIALPIKISQKPQFEIELKKNTKNVIRVNSNLDLEGDKIIVDGQMDWFERRSGSIRMQGTKAVGFTGKVEIPSAQVDLTLSSSWESLYSISVNGQLKGQKALGEFSINWPQRELSLNFEYGQREGSAILKATRNGELNMKYNKEALELKWNINNQAQEAIVEGKLHLRQQTYNIQGKLDYGRQGTWALHVTVGDIAEINVALDSKMVRGKIFVIDNKQRKHQFEVRGAIEEGRKLTASVDIDCPFLAGHKTGYLTIEVNTERNSQQALRTAKFETKVGNMRPLAIDMNTLTSKGVSKIAMNVDIPQLRYGSFKVNGEGNWMLWSAQIEAILPEKQFVSLSFNPRREFILNTNLIRFGNNKFSLTLTPTGIESQVIFRNQQIFDVEVVLNKETRLAGTGRAHWTTSKGSEEVVVSFDLKSARKFLKLTHNGKVVLDLETGMQQRIGMKQYIKLNMPIWNINLDGTFELTNELYKILFTLNTEQLKNIVLIFEHAPQDKSLQHKLRLSWEDDRKAIGYDLRYTKKNVGDIEMYLQVDTPVRSVRSTLKNQREQTRADLRRMTRVQIQWDVTKDESKKIELTHELSKKTVSGEKIYMSELAFSMPTVQKYIANKAVLTIRGNNAGVLLHNELRYHRDEKRAIVAEFFVIPVTGKQLRNFSTEMRASLSQEYSGLNLMAHLEATNNFERSDIVAKYGLTRMSKPNTFRAHLDKQSMTLKSLIQSEALEAQLNAQLVKTNKEWRVIAHHGTKNNMKESRLTLNKEMLVAILANDFTMVVKPHGLGFVAELKHKHNGAVLNDAKVAFGITPENNFISSIHWRNGFVKDIKQHAEKTMQKINQHTASAAELVAVRRSIQKLREDIKQESMPIKQQVQSGLETIRMNIIDLKNELNRLYRRDVFYIRSIVERADDMWRVVRDYTDEYTYKINKWYRSVRSATLEQLVDTLSHVAKKMIRAEEVIQKSYRAISRAYNKKTKAIRSTIQKTVEQARDQSANLVARLDKSTESMTLRVWVSKMITYAKQRILNKSEVLDMTKEILLKNVCVISNKEVDLRTNACGLIYNADIKNGKIESAVVLPATLKQMIRSIPKYAW